MPQGRIVFNQMTVKENLEMGAYIERDQKKIDDAMDYVFTLFPRLGERQKQLGGTMSGGEQQMLAMGRALMTRPKMIMLDEPSLGLSPRFVTEVFEKIVSLAKEGLTIMLVEQNAARALGDFGSGLRAGTRPEPLSGRRPRTPEQPGSQDDVPGRRLAPSHPSVIVSSESLKCPGRSLRWNLSTL